jgi:hypothetical protein
VDRLRPLINLNQYRFVMILSEKQFLPTLAINIGRCCPKKRRSLDVIMKRISRDPLLLKKLSPGTVVEVSDSNSHIKYDMNGKKKGAPVVIKIKCSDTSYFEAVLNGENIDKLRLWAEEKIEMVGDLATSMIVTDAIFRYVELIGQLNLPWFLYQLIGRSLIQREDSCIPPQL